MMTTLGDLLDLLEPFVMSYIRLGMVGWGTWMAAHGAFVGQPATSEAQFTGAALIVAAGVWHLIKNVAVTKLKTENKSFAQILFNNGLHPAQAAPAQTVIPPAADVRPQPSGASMTVSRSTTFSLPTLPPMNTLTALAIAVLTSFLLAGTARAQTPAPTPVKAPAVSNCTIDSCSGFYVGANLVGAGTSSNITNTGISSSVLNAGGMLGGTAGWQFWNGTWFAAVDVKADYDATGTNGGKAGYFFSEMIKVGGALQLVTGQGAPSQGPLQIAGLTMLTPYFESGPVERPFATGWGVGAGTEFALGGPYMFDISYLHVGYNTTINPSLTVNSEDLITLGINRKF